MSLDLTSRRNSERSATLSVVALALVPFASLPFAPTQRLAAQAALILALLVVQLFWLREPARPLPSLLRFGLAAWLAAATWGTVVGFLSGNPIRYVAGQSLSMLLLPLAALVFWLRTGFSTRTLLRGLAIAVVVALAMHLLMHGFGAEAAGSEPVAAKRLRTAPSVSFVGTALLVGLLCVGGLRGSGKGRGLVAAGALSAGILVVGGFSRGQWLAGIVGLTILALATLGARRRVWYAAAGAVFAVAALAALYARIASEPVVLPTDTRVWHLGSEGSPGNRQLVRVEWDDAVGAKVSTRVSGPAGEALTLWVEAAAENGTRFQRTATRVLEANTPGNVEEDEDKISPVYATVSIPPDSRQLRIGARVTGGPWTIEDLHVRRIDSSLATWIQAWSSRPSTIQGQDPSMPAVARWRIQQLIWALADPSSDVTVRYRSGESAAALAAWREESWLRRLVGAGLGATVDHAIPSFDARGERVLVERTSYLHNFYLFLAFKLGILGLLPLAAQVAFALQAFLLGRRHGWLGHAAFAAWLAYGLWSISSPEILDFRRAVLWGLLIAACGRAEVSSLPISRSAGAAFPNAAAWRRVIGGG